jgi:hypothetical protein
MTQHMGVNLEVETRTLADTLDQPIHRIDACPLPQLILLLTR